MSKIVKSSSTSFEDQLYKAMNERFSQLQRKAGLSGGGETRGVYQHSGMCMLDIVLGGGVPPGGWISAVGPEGSAKSTATQTIMVNCAGQVPINRMWDYEGSSDLNYLENIMRTDHIKMSLDELLGVKDKKGNVLVPGRVTYQDANVLEDFFDIEAAFLRSLPDKLYLDGGWWYCFDDDKYGREMVGGKHDKNMKAKYGKLCVPAKDGTMQAILLIDSLPSMLPRSMDVEDAKAGMALQARLFSDNIKKVKGKLRSKKVTILAVNQLREKPGVLYGDPLYEPCGQAARFYSDCRIRFSSRSSVRGIKGKFEEEEGVNGGTDTYMYIHARAHKNKFGAQNVEGWFRVWVSDKFGKGHGFDPVFDTLEYLNVTGQVEGRRNKLTIRAPGCVNKKSLTHLQFKTLIIGNVEQVTKVQRDCGMIGKKDKAFRIRNVLKKQMKSGEGLDLFFKHKAENGDGQED